MKHSSIKLNTPCEFINVVPVNPLISKCQIKVCYVGEEPNRNKSVITKEAAIKMAQSLPGSPIVGFFNSEEQDFEEHNRSISINDGKFEIKDDTRPYGFVDLNAKVWFQKFLDDGVNEREYLVTEGYLWTGQYEEAKRIIEQGNNQSMELDKKNLNASWTKDSNGKPEFFIINEAIISKLCILGEDYEPCFEGASIAKVEFSLGDDFKEELYSMIKQVSDLLNKIEEGGEREMEKDFSLAEENAVEEVTETESLDFAEEVEEAPQVEEAENEEKIEEEDKEDKSEPSNSDISTEEEISSEEEKEDSEEVVEEELPSEEEEVVSEEPAEVEKTYNLEDISEYVELSKNYIKLESEFSVLESERDELLAELNSLKEFKLGIERKEKEKMINETFYMLSDEEKADVKENIDKYSLDDIEAKLSVICIRNKVFNLDPVVEEEKEEELVFSLDDEVEDNYTPAWVKAALETAKKID